LFDTFGLLHCIKACDRQARRSGNPPGRRRLLIIGLDLKRNAKVAKGRTRRICKSFTNEAGVFVNFIVFRDGLPVAGGPV
jgi:hypothetical protein